MTINIILKVHYVVINILSTDRLDANTSNNGRHLPDGTTFCCIEEKPQKTAVS